MLDSHDARNTGCGLHPDVSFALLFGPSSQHQRCVGFVEFGLARAATSVHSMGHSLERRLPPIVQIDSYSSLPFFVWVVHVSQTILFPESNILAQHHCLFICTDTCLQTRGFWRAAMISQKYFLACCCKNARPMVQSIL